MIIGLATSRAIEDSLFLRDIPSRNNLSALLVAIKRDPDPAVQALWDRVSVHGTDHNGIVLSPVSLTPPWGSGTLWPTVGATEIC